MNKFNVIATLLLFLLSDFTWAQSSCLENEFEDITLTCISNSKKPYSEQPIPIKKIKKNTILAYKTAGGEIGKLKIFSVIHSQTKGIPREDRAQCTVFIDALTYGSDNGFVPKSSLSISAKKNHWLTDKIYLDKEGLSALELEKNNKTGECVLVLTKGTSFATLKEGSDEEAGFKEDNYALFFAPLFLSL